MSVPGLLAQSVIGAALGGSANNAGRNQFKQAYEVNAVILLGGIAGASYNNTLLFSDIAQGMDFKFVPMPGGSVGSNQVATYPFANQAVAANAIIQQPLTISLMMIVPANPDSVGYLAKNAAFSALAASLQQHDNLGGLYSIQTPAYTYLNCLRLGMFDASDGRSKQSQFQWRLDFYQPLITLAAAQAAQNSLYSALTNQTPITGTPSASGLNTGNPGVAPVTSNVSLTAPSSLQ